MTASFCVLLFGGSGQVGSELRRRPWPVPVNLVTPTRRQIDLVETARLAEFVAGSGADIVVNAAAFTAVDAAESQADLAYAINSAAPAALAAAAEAARIPLIHLSTDYVFDGEQARPYKEDDVTNPLSVYGKTKAQGEVEVRRRASRHVIIRTSWLYGAIGGTNFVKTMLRLGAERRELPIVNDQRGTPTSAADVADAIAIVVQRLGRGDGAYGTYHFTAIGETTWYGFGSEIFALLNATGVRSPRLIAIPTSEYPTPARRPSHSTLDCTRIENAYGVTRRPWRDAVPAVMGELLRLHDSERDMAS